MKAKNALRCATVTAALWWPPPRPCARSRSASTSLCGSVCLPDTTLQTRCGSTRSHCHGRTRLLRLPWDPPLCRSCGSPACANRQSSPQPPFSPSRPSPSATPSGTLALSSLPELEPFRSRRSSRRPSPCSRAASQHCCSGRLFLRRWPSRCFRSCLASRWPRCQSSHSLGCPSLVPCSPTSRLRRAISSRAHRWTSPRART
mmetsp:Transcript_58634/g.134527  ORF Transcript_58634/g.134527 Transcript_58634/m.134527 type:complete len:202 (-) Transcript_58634:911-1516(-)